MGNGARMVGIVKAATIDLEPESHIGSSLLTIPIHGAIEWPLADAKYSKIIQDIRFDTYHLSSEVMLVAFDSLPASEASVPVDNGPLSQGSLRFENPRPIQGRPAQPLKGSTIPGEQILGFLLSGDEREAIIGDFTELFATRVKNLGKWRAVLWAYQETVQALPSAITGKLKRVGTGMFRRGRS